LIDESLLVDSKGGLANAIVFARNKNLKSDKSAEGNVVLDNNGCHFQPHIAVMQAGQTLVVKNSDPVSHNTNASLVANAPFNVTVPVGSPLNEKINLPEQSPVPVVCTIHPWMKGYIVVQPHPFVAVSAKDGTFEIKNAPAGIPLEFQAWHESSSNRSGALVADRPDLKWQPNGRFSVTLKPDETMDLGDIKIPAAAIAAR
jgi:plastocyanin